MAKTPIEAILDTLEYEEIPNPENNSGLPYATHTGKLKVGKIEFTVLVLNTGQRIIPVDEIEKFSGSLES